MRIVIVQTTIVIDIPEENKQPAPKPVHPLTLLEKVLKATEAEHESTPGYEPQEKYYGTFLT